MPLCTTPAYANVGVVGALRLADRDEVHVVLQERVVAPRRFGPRPVQRVHHRRAPSQQRAQRGADDAAVVVHDVEVVVDLEVRATSAWYASYHGLPSSAGSGGSSIGVTTIAALVSRAAAREERDVVPAVDQTVGEQRDDELDPAVAGGRHGEPGRRDLGDPHARRIRGGRASRSRR